MRAPIWQWNTQKSQEGWWLRSPKYDWQPIFRKAFKKWNTSNKEHVVSDAHYQHVLPQNPPSCPIWQFWHFHAQCSEKKVMSRVSCLSFEVKLLKQMEGTNSSQIKGRHFKCMADNMVYPRHLFFFFFFLKYELVLVIVHLTFIPAYTHAHKKKKKKVIQPIHGDEWCARKHNTLLSLFFVLV